MKTILLPILAVLFGLTFQANARDYHRHHNHVKQTKTYISGYRYDGSPIVTKRVFVRYDRYSRPIYRYYTVPQPRRTQRHHSHHRNHGYNRGYNRGYHRGYNRGGCSGGGITFRF